MHPRNEMRLLAGLAIDHTLEITEAREVPNRKDTAPATEKNLAKKLKDLAKAALHLENAAKALESAPATDTNAEIPQIIKDIEELITDVNNVADKTAKVKPLKEDQDTVKEMDISFDTSGDDSVINEPSMDTEVVDSEEDTNVPSSTSDFGEGDVVLFDNGIWVVYKHDKEANKVGIIPPDLHGKEAEECAKAMQMVDPGKVRRPNNAESSILTSGADNKIGTEDDIRTESVKTCTDCGCTVGAPKEGCNCTKCKTEEEECEKMNESTLNYTASNQMSWKEVEQNPTNSVAQGEDNWKTEPRSERPQQPAENKDRNSDVVQTVKVPAKIKSALKKAAGEFEAEAKRQSSGATAEENRQFYEDAAAAFNKLNDMLDGTFEGMQKAQIFASSLMGPLLHKLPSDVWKFISNGGQARGLKDYMVKAK